MILRVKWTKLQRQLSQASRVRRARRTLPWALNIPAELLVPASEGLVQSCGKNALSRPYKKSLSHFKPFVHHP